jgi:peptidoglycan/LPS O-acetylase OafA/YrhL
VRVYFKNLNGLRFIAAFSVIISHVEMVKMVFGDPHSWDTKPVKLLGHLGVVLFFVLSGFLITYLLLAEKKVTQSISIKQFYIRRVLRIWPLYFLLVLLALFAFPNIPFLEVPGDEGSSGGTWLKTALYLLILPNVAVKLFPAVPFIGQTWSIGVEEQFYLIWPWLVKKARNVLTVLLAVIIVYLLILFGLDFLSARDGHAGGWHIASEIWHVTSIDCMAIGGVFAWLHFYKKESILRFIRNDIMELISVLIVISFIVKGVRFPILHHEIYAVLFGVIILNLATKDKTVLYLEHPVLDYLGKVSYGVYMYHVLCIVIAYKAIAATAGSVNSWLLYGLSIALTIVVSAISFELLENPFIKMKARFTKIISGDSARK